MSLMSTRSFRSAGRSLLRAALLPLALAMTLVSQPAVSVASAADQHPVHALKITVLVTNVAGDPRAGDGEWGFSALVEVDGKKILYDTGASSDLVLRNARALHLDLSDVEDVVLSHNHWDHVGGLLALRAEFSKSNPKAMSRVHVAAGIFRPRWTSINEDHNGLKDIRAQYLATGGNFIVHDGPTELMPGVWFTGPVPRPNNEKNWSPGLSLDTPSGRIEDNVPEDGALLFDTPEGTVILTGCGHAGVINIVEYVRHLQGARPLIAIVGGIHLFAATDDEIAWTGQKLKQYGLQNLLAAHCTGFEATYRLRQIIGLGRANAVVAATGSSFTLGRGIDPLFLAK